MGNIAWAPAEAPRGMPQVEVQMDVDLDGILHVKATDLDGGASEQVEIARDKNRLMPDEIERMVSEAQQFEEQDKQLREKTQSKVAFEQLAYEARNKAKEQSYKDVMTEEEVKTVEDAANEAIKWLDDNGADASKDELDAKLAELSGKVKEILDKAKSKVDASGKGAAEGSDDSGKEDESAKEEKVEKEEPKESGDDAEEEF